MVSRKSGYFSFPVKATRVQFVFISYHISDQWGSPTKDSYNGTIELTRSDTGGLPGNRSDEIIRKHTSYNQPGMLFHIKHCFMRNSLRRSYLASVTFLTIRTWFMPALIASPTMGIGLGGGMKHGYDKI